MVWYGIYSTDGKSIPCPNAFIAGTFPQELHCSAASITNPTLFQIPPYNSISSPNPFPLAIVKSTPPLSPINLFSNSATNLTLLAGSKNSLKLLSTSSTSTTFALLFCASNVLVVIKLLAYLSPASFPNFVKRASALGERSTSSSAARMARIWRISSAV